MLKMVKRLLDVCGPVFVMTLISCLNFAQLHARNYDESCRLNRPRGHFWIGASLEDQNIYRLANGNMINDRPDESSIIQGGITFDLGQCRKRSEYLMIAIGSSFKNRSSEKGQEDLVKLTWVRRPAFVIFLEFPPFPRRVPAGLPIMNRFVVLT